MKTYCRTIALALPALAAAQPTTRPRPSDEPENDPAEPRSCHRCEVEPTNCDEALAQPPGCASSCSHDAILAPYQTLGCDFDIALARGLRFKFNEELIVRAADEVIVAPGVPFVPEVARASTFSGIGEFTEICGHWFWNNHNGATAVCNALGYPSGSLEQERWARTPEDWTGNVLGTDALFIGECNPGETLGDCSANQNRYDYSCKAGSRAGIVVICSDAVPEPVPPHPADDKNEDDAAELYPCSDAIANCQCSKSKVDSGYCGGRAPGCFYEPGGQEECNKHGDYWLGGLESPDEDTLMFDGASEHCEGGTTVGTTLDRWSYPTQAGCREACVSQSACTHYMIGASERWGHAGDCLLYSGCPAGVHYGGPSVETYKLARSQEQQAHAEDAEDAAGKDSSDLPHRTARSLRKSPKSLLRGDAK